LTVERSVGPEQRAAGAVIEQAGVALASRRSDIPAGFVAQLFGRAAADDVLGYGADDLARLSERAFDFLKQRTPGTAKIHCGTVRLTASGERKSVTVIEVSNDDMPFLVDSVLG
jgi:glutamate dehydrogenase